MILNLALGQVHYWLDESITSNLTPLTIALSLMLGRVHYWLDESITNNLTPLTIDLALGRVYYWLDESIINNLTPPDYIVVSPYYTYYRRWQAPCCC